MRTEQKTKKKKKKKKKKRIDFVCSGPFYMASLDNKTS